MALTPEEIKSVNEEFNKLVNKLDEIDQKTLSRTREALLSGKVTLEEWNRELKRFKTTADNVGNSLSYIANSFKDSVNELQKQNKYLSSAKTIINDVSKSAQAALNVRRGETDINVKNLTQAKQLIDSQREQLELSLKNGNLTKSQRGEIYKTLNDLPAYKAGLEGVLETNEKINKELGFGPQLLGGLDKALQKLGLPPLGVKDAIDETRRLGQVAAATGDKDFKALGTFTSKLGENLKNALSPANLLLVAFGAIVKNVLSLNKAQTDLRRNLGESANTLNLIDNRFGTIADQIGTINSLTEQFGFNTIAAFDAINLREATELTKALGLSAEETGMLAFNAQVSGENLRDGAKESYRGISPLLSQRKVLQEISQVAPSITLAFKNSNVELAKAASNAKLLGLNLSQVDKIAGGLLEIEQSLTSEFEAEAILGKELNLERARFFALTNDIDGLTKEIANNQEIINSFSSGTRIEQEAIAGAFGLSRDELSKMVQEQAILGKMSAKEIKDKELADSKRLDVQQSLNDSIAKMAEVLAGPVELMADFLVSTKSLLSLFLGIGTAMATMKAIQFAIVTQKRISLALTRSESIAEAAKAAISAITNPVGAAIGLVMGGLVFAAAQGYLKKGDDIMSPGEGSSGYGKRTLMGPEGAIALNNKDTVIAGTNLFPQPEKGIDKQFSTPTPQESKPLEIRGLDKLLSAFSIQTESSISSSIPTPTPQESQPLEIRGLDKLLSAFSIQPSKQLELNQASSPIQPLGREIEPSLPTSAPLPERGIGRNTPTATSVAIDYDKLADAIAMGAERGTSKANLNVNLDGNRVSNALQTPQAMNTRRYGI